ncbi:bifunctional methylenetetrahydrofolate dehydrogenase/methenyltetrahydrofolate cyclohydrolase [Novosphingobium pentaromativorans]|uniref:Bifunctional protein FolD n=1 Tax=Novosphingobium pentaromativorans US6-1 TaxID=1088721 RepID=G6EHF0_9SPHN|nr:bifunctional methylenetetrahydrofolate dehydrogenase/methenyltetrahydrofolate cyclohydrolase [Novosphingobium pentaromativorans]AIT81892.1 methenyltetrahydrofolate cyclohydrolase [Novosphingobium pentaromativorans US6-1]EHJ59439.1 methylenetetrahydrofolate dehydrogenase (NADP+)-methenyltetrahydrofolate cyclohydrolase [Novosphingobium pentaromativorans US6-1]
MTAIIDGIALARRVSQETADTVSALAVRLGQAPGLAVVLVGNDPASEVYVGRKIRECRKVGLRSIEHRLPASTREAELLSLIADLNVDPGVHGILVQLPLPPHIDAGLVLDAIAPGKDVDGFHPVNVGRLSTGTGGLVPCTPLGIMMLLDTVISDYRGLDAVVIGKSNIVGKPVAMLLLEREATVTVTHIETRGLSEIVRKADIVVAAAGSPGLVKGFWVKEGAVIIDVGITRVTRPDGTSALKGDVAFDEVQHARAVTPVPGGVGPMTIACLLSNTAKAAALSLEGPGGRIASSAG